MVDTSRPFWERTSPLITYSGLSQGKNPFCVYSSVAGAVNHVSGRAVWDTPSIEQACRHLGSPSFNVVPIAFGPVSTEIEQDVAGPRLDSGTDEEYLDAIRAHVVNGGVAVVSFEVSDQPPPAIRRTGNFHMLSLVAFKAGIYQVWDTQENVGNGFVTEQELLTGIEYFQGLWLVTHPDKDCALFKKAGT